MFSYLRYFSTVSFLLIIISAFATGFYYRSVVANDIIRVLAEENNIAFTNSFTNSIWKRYFNAPGLLKNSSETLNNSQVFTEFKKQTFSYISTIPVVEFTLFAPDGKKIFAGGKEVPDSEDAEHAAHLESAKAGKIESSIIGNIWFKDFKSGNKIMIRSFVPIYHVDNDFVVGRQAATKPGAKLEGIAELVYDSTTIWQQPQKIQIVSTVTIIAIFTVLYLSLLFTISRAEKIITRQHEANIELTAAKARAEAENQEKSKFLANISHELRTPLNAIIGFSEIIKDEVMGPLNNDQYKDYTTDIHASGVHLLSLINDILDYSKAEAGKLDVELIDVDVTKVLKSCLRLIAPRAEAASVNLIDEIPNEHFVVKTDPKRLKQIILNLLSNSVKFTPANGRITLSAWYNVTEGNLNVIVKDTGIGIAPKDISKVMSTFGQVENEYNRKFEGTGLGLPLSKKLIELMGGRFIIESEVNMGTTVTLVLPKDNVKDNTVEA